MSWLRMGRRGPGGIGGRRGCDGGDGRVMEAMGMCIWVGEVFV